jgi:hypothetical protein
MTKSRFPSSVTVLVDTREQVPILFPASVRLDGCLIKLKKKKVALAEGDYALEDKEHTCIIERKYGLRELQNNLLTVVGWKRFKKAVTRLKDATYNPVILLDCRVGDLVTETEKCPDPLKVLDRLFNLCGELGIHLVLTGRSDSSGARRLLGKFAVQMLLSYAYPDEARASAKVPRFKVEV